MNETNSTLTKDALHIWHPASPRYFKEPPFVVNKAEDNIINTTEGPIIDAISSWWCKTLGHKHPKVIAAIEEQLKNFEHIIPTNTTHKNLAAFGEKIHNLSGMQHILFANDGSSAVEIAMKLALYTRHLENNSHKKTWLALKNSYHGETLATLAVSDLEQYKAPFQANIMQNCTWITDLPYGNNALEDLNIDAYWQKTQKKLEAIKDTIVGLIAEPLLQGAAGMLCYNKNYLAKLLTWAKENKIPIILDEIMTGFGRTGTWFAYQHINIKPDFVCISKGVTGGTIPMSCVLVNDDAYKIFATNKAEFLHSHTYSANPLAIAAALATIEVLEEEKLIPRANYLSKIMYKAFQELNSKTKILTNIRSLGAMVAAEIEDKNLMLTITKNAREAGVLLRPIGNTIYWLLPLNTKESLIEELQEKTLLALKK